MRQFQYSRPATQQVVIDAINKPGTKIIAGGTNLVDLMKRGVTAPGKLIDINQLPLKNIAPIIKPTMAIIMAASKVGINPAIPSQTFFNYIIPTPCSWATA